MHSCLIFFFNDTATTEIYTLSLHDALPIFRRNQPIEASQTLVLKGRVLPNDLDAHFHMNNGRYLTLMDLGRSEEHTSELQSRQYLVCRLLLEKKKKHKNIIIDIYITTFNTR